MPVPVISSQQMREWEEATWKSGVLEMEVIKKAGQCVARTALGMTKPGESILILVGRGHNGDDARQCAPHLTARDVHILSVISPESAFKEFTQAVSAKTRLLIDGLFGIGLDRPLDEKWTRFIQQINHSGIPILSVDIPSGLNPDTGEYMGAAIYAAVTLTLGMPKRGLLMPAAWNHVGRLEVAPDIGLAPKTFPAEWYWTLPQDFIGFPPPRPVNTHKGTYGHVVLMAGSVGYHGAAVMAARAAAQAKPGLVSLFVPSEIYGAVASQLQSVMVHPWTAESQLPENATSIVIGPGLASPALPESFKARAQELWKTSEVPVVADASALDWLPTDPFPANAVRVITPHPGEAARMLGTDTETVQAGRPDALIALSRKWNQCWVVLKGHQSLIGREGNAVYFNCSGNPYLAQGGSGDVLSGFLGALLAQSALQEDPFTAIRYAVWQHGAVADKLQAENGGWVVEDLIAGLGSVR